MDLDEGRNVNINKSFLSKISKFKICKNFQDELYQSFLQEM
jgi:hypothetical protein